MKLEMFAVYDAKARTYCTPFFSENVAVAIRAFAHAANDNQTDVGRFPSDFTLFHLGVFDSESGVIEPDAHPFEVVRAQTLVEA